MPDPPVEQPPEEQHLGEQDAAVDVWNTSVLVTDSVQNIASSSAGSATESARNRTAAPAGRPRRSSPRVEEHEPLCERTPAGSRRRHQQGPPRYSSAGRRGRSARCRCPAAPEVRHRAVHRAEVVGDVAVGGQHIAAVDDRHDRERHAERKTVAALAGPDRGRNAFSRTGGRTQRRGM